MKTLIKNDPNRIPKGTLISGHNRVKAAKFAGITEIEVIILEDYPDDDSKVWDVYGLPIMVILP